MQGDLTGDGTHTYQWDAEGRLKSVDSGTTAAYTYNALGWRVEKKLGSAYTEYLFGASGDRLGENNRSAWTESYVPLGYGHYAIYQNNATYFTHPNALGSTTMVTDYNGNVVQDKLFYPWGQDWQIIRTVYDERFAKLQRRDTETSLDPTPNRMFASGEGRWLSPDPYPADVTDPQTFNRYAYGLNSPCTLTDPLGLSTCDFDIGIKNQAGLSTSQLSAAEAQINAILGAVASTSGDTVGAHFNSSGKADYTLDIVSGNPSGNLGWQNSFFFIQPSATVNAAAIGSMFASRLIGQVIGTFGAHELAHRITGVRDLPLGHGLMSIDALAAQDAANQPPTFNAYNLLATPGVPSGLQLTPALVSALYGKCNKKHPNASPAPGVSGGGPGGPGSSGNYVFVVTGGWCGGEGASGCSVEGYWAGPFYPQRK